MAKIENFKYSISDAFQQCLYIVPDYQREYVWTEKEVHQLLDDINDEIDVGSTKEYFIGTILVAPAQEKGHYEVIDGQQRLTTFFLLLCVLKHLFKGDPQESLIAGLISTSYADISGETRTSLKLEPRYENAGEIMAKIVEVSADPDRTKNAIQSSGIGTYGSLENLVSAYGTIYHYLKDNYPDKTDLKKYWGYLANNVVFIQISTDISSALKIFETINERGVGLNPMDLLKNLLFTHVKTEEFNKLKDEWKKITKPLEKQKEKPLRFLRYFLMANYHIDNNRSDATVREDEIYDWFIDKKNAKLCNYSGKPFEFVRKVIKNVDNFVAFSAGKGNDGQDNIYMDNLRRLSGSGFSLHYVLLLSASTFPKPLFDHFLVQLETFLFYYIFTKTQTKVLERNFSLWADELREISEITEPSAQVSQYNEFLRDRFEKNTKAKGQELRDDLNRYTLNSMQKYRTRYVLAKLTQCVDMAFTGTKTQTGLGDYFKLEIEHILPNTPTAKFRSAFELANPGKDYDLYKTKLGNLTLLEKPINIVASNDYFFIKSAEYRKSKNYLTSSMAGLVPVGHNSSISRINESLEPYESWGSETIDSRQGKLIDLIFQVWKLSIYDHN